MIDFTSTMAVQQPPPQLRLANGISIKRFDQLENLILQNNPKDVVLFGEGDFTFSIALASLRKNGSRGIIATRYERETDENPLPQFNDVKIKAIENCIHNGGRGINKDGSPWGLGLNAERKVENIQAVLAVRDAFPQLWQAGVDATHIPPDLVVADKVVWFQCPYSITPTTRKLIKKFFQEMNRRQNNEDYLLIGIANKKIQCNGRTHNNYIDKYYLPGILGGGQGTTPINGYRFCGGDNELIKKILECGYKHKGRGKIHKLIFSCHVTLVFRKENQDQDRDLAQRTEIELNISDEEDEGKEEEEEEEDYEEEEEEEEDYEDEEEED